MISKSSLSILSLLWGVLSSPVPESQEIHAGTALKIPGLERAGYTAYKHEAIAFQQPSGFRVTPHILTVNAVEGDGPSARFIDMMLNRDTPDPITNKTMAKAAGLAPIKNVKNFVYLTEVKFGNQDFVTVIDTGSSDTWLVETGFKCVGTTGKQMSQAMCRFGKAYSKTASFVNVAEQKFATKYADGEVLQGGMGRETVNLGGITVENQTVGIVNSASWKGDGQSSGLIGMAFPTLTRALVNSKAVKYDPVFFNMYKSKLIDPVFSVVLNRADEGPGAIALGGMPGPQYKYDDRRWAKVPMEKMGIKTSPKGPVIADYTLYAVKISSFNVNNKTVGSVAPTIIDSGTTMSYIPQAAADAMAAAFQPAATLQRGGIYTVPCSAKPPKFGVNFGNTTMWIEGKDLLLQSGLGQPCMVSIQSPKSLGPAAPPFSILGGPFMKSVISVFDVGAAEIRFAQRVR